MLEKKHELVFRLNGAINLAKNKNTRNLKTIEEELVEIQKLVIDLFYKDELCQKD